MKDIKDLNNNIFGDAVVYSSSTEDENDVVDTVNEFNLAEDEVKKAYVKVLEFITNTFYKTKDNDFINIVLTDDNNLLETSGNYYDGKKIVLSKNLMEAFGKVNLPRFLIYYHELGHTYTQGYFALLKNGVV